MFPIQKYGISSSLQNVFCNFALGNPHFMQFLNPCFLIGLVAVAIPIIIHLFHFRKYKKVYFSNVSMLKSIQTTQRKQERLKHRLVLLFRILAIVFLVLAFARPYFPKKDLLLTKGKENKVAIYVDNSFSMENSSSDGILFEQAKQKALETVDAFSPSDKFMLVTNDFEGKHRHFVGKEQFQVLVNELSIGPSTRKISEVLKFTQSFAKNSSSRHFVVMISDFQKSFADLENIESDSTSTCFLIPLTAQQNDNLYIDTIFFSAPVFQADYDVTVTVRVANSGKEKIEKLPVKLFVNDQQRAITSVDIEADEKQDATLTFKIEKTGFVKGKITITDYPLVFDDEFFFAFHAGDPLNVLCVNGKAENPFIRRLFSDDPQIQYEEISEKNIPYGRLSEFDFIILNELPELNETLMSEVKDLGEQGGNVLVIPSEKANTEGYKEVLTRYGFPFFDTPINKPLSVSEINTKHRLYKGVFEKIPQNMELPSLQKGFHVQTSSQTPKESILTLASGDDFLWECPLGSGNIYFMACPLTEEYSNFMNRALFVPTIYNMALFSNKTTPPFYYLGSPYPIVVRTRSETNHDKEPVKISSLKGDFSLIPEQYRRTQNLIVKPNGQIKQAGHYAIVTQDTTLAIVGLNYMREESIQQFLSEKQLKEKIKNLGSEKQFHILNGVNVPLKKQIQTLENPPTLSLYLLIVALVCLLAEVLLLRFYHKGEKKDI